MEKCCICGAEIEKEHPPVLSFGHFGHPRCLCDGCEERLDTITLGKEYAEIREAMEKVTEDYEAIGGDDPVVTEALENIYEKAEPRAEKIADGTYDFAEDILATEEDEEEIEVPEELTETEEDRERDAREEENRKKSDHAMNIAATVTFAIILGIMIYFFFFR